MSETSETGIATDPMDVAVVGMAGRFPGADTVDELWDHLLHGRDLTTPISAERFTEINGRPPGPNSVLREAAVRGVDEFDHEYFSIPAAEAARMDPQHRLFIQSCHHALEDAGYDPSRTEHLIGVYAGSGQGDYLMRNVLPTIQDGPASVEMFSAAVANLVSSMPTRAAYLLGLQGPAQAIQTACSSSLVAVHTACQDLISFRCDMALAGGATLDPTPGSGYDYEPGGLLSSDGRCRAFDAGASGMASGDGVGVVVLKRLSDAVSAGDHIHAVISGSAVNNDGNRKVGFTAPSVQGQAEVIREALAAAEVDPDEIGYVEAHGTGTLVGDPIEISALTRAFGDAAGPCLVGSVKATLGHTDTAAGVIGLMKAVLCVQHGIIPASLHSGTPNPELRLDETPFELASVRSEWPRPGRRRAGVSSFGIGGTNAHVILSQAPDMAEGSGKEERRTGPEVITLSSATPEQLDEQRIRLADHLATRAASSSALALSDVGFVLDKGRRRLPYRWAAFATDLGELQVKLTASHGVTGTAPEKERKVAFVFSGAGALRPGLIPALRGHPLFAEHIAQAEETCHELGIDLSAMGDNPTMTYSTSAEFCATVAVEHAMVAALRACGVEPCAVLGNSLGEYPAAVVAGVLSLRDALVIVNRRGRLLEEAGGRTLMVPQGAEELERVLEGFPQVDLAAVNGPHSCLVSGAEEELGRLQRHFDHEGIEYSPLPVSGAVHSHLLDPLLEDFHHDLVSLGIGESIREPELDFFAAANGAQLKAVDVPYFVRQTRERVLFAASVEALRSAHDDPLILEVGPGRGLAAAVRSMGGESLYTAPRAGREDQAHAAFAEVLATLWTRGAPVSCSAFSAAQDHRRVSLPGYPFARSSHWISAEAGGRTRMPRGDASAPVPGTTRPALIPGALDRRWPQALDRAEPGEPLIITHPVPVFPAARTAPSLAEIAPEDGTGEMLDPEGDQLLNEYAALLAAPALSSISEPAPPFDRLRAEIAALVDGHHAAEVDDAAVKTLRGRISQSRPDLAADLDLLEHCSAHLVPVISGDETGVEALFGHESIRDLHFAVEERRAASLLERSRSSVVDVIRSLLRIADDRPLRVLEIGAGRGFVTWPVAEELQRHGGHAEYTVTDVGASLVGDAAREAEHRGVDFLRFATLDAGAAPSEQGFAPHSYDVVIAFNSLHAVPDLPQACATVSELLSPGGTAIVLELQVLPGHGLLSAGLLEGMWHHTDGVRKNLPIVEPQQWQEQLTVAGVQETRVVLPDGRRGHHALILGRSPATEAARRLATLREKTGKVDVLVGDVPALRTEDTLSLIPSSSSASAPKPSERRPMEETRERQQADDTEVSDTAGQAARPTAEPESASSPASLAEHYLAAVLGEMLGMPQLSRESDFFDQGGDSLLAMRALGRIRRDVGVDVSSRALFEHPTVSGLAAHLESLDAHFEPSPEPAGPRLRRRGKNAVLGTDGSLVLEHDTAPADGYSPAGEGSPR